MSTKVTQQVNKKNIAPYEDATRPLYVEVNKLDIKRAKCFAPDDCVLARALCRALPNATKAWFYEHGAYVALADPKTGKPTKTVRYMPSPEARKSIGTFDLTRKFVPGTYRLDPPTGSATLERIRGRCKKGRHKPTGKGTSRTPRHTIQPEKKSRQRHSYGY
jgi:hypothetical protein